MALTTLTVLVGAIIITAVGREKRGIHFGGGASASTPATKPSPVTE
jgi:hypothetical protein